MDEPVPCPNCQALLRLPAGATTVRCPSCKAVLELDTDDEPAPPPARRAAPVPLPFGRPTKPAPAPTRPDPVAPPRGKAIKARVVPEDPYSATPAAVEVDEDERERDIRRQLRELDAEARKKDARYKVLSGECDHARTGLAFLAAGALFSVGSALAALLFQFGGVVGGGSGVVVFAGLGGGLLVAHWLLTLLGFGFCVAGPREVRGTAGLGIAFTAGHLIFSTVAFVCVAASVGLDMLRENDRGDTTTFASLMIGNCVCNLTVVSDLPYYVLYPSHVRPIAVILLLVAAGFEFAKLSAIALMANQYATLAKDPDLAHNGMRFVYRVFAVVLLGPTVKWVSALTLASGVVWIPLILASIGYYLWWSFAWAAQYRVLLDIREILTALRLMDRRQRYDVV